MESLRYRISDRLLEAGATQALEIRQMRCRMARSSNARAANNVHVQAAVASTELWSSIAIRIGMLIRPRRLPRLLISADGSRER
jgi:hypothetical protein